MEKIKDLWKNKKAVLIAGILIFFLIVTIVIVAINTKNTKATASAGEVSKAEQVGVTHYKENVEMKANKDTNVYTDCMDKANSMGFVAKGEKITVTGITKNNWYEVLYMGSVGYMKKKDLEAEEDKETETVKETKKEEPTTQEETTPEMQTDASETVKETEYVEQKVSQVETPASQPETPASEQEQPAPQPQPVPAPEPEPQPQPQPQPVVNESCELPGVTSMIYSDLDSHNRSNKSLEAGVYDACLNVVNKWINGSISRETAISTIMSNPTITTDSDGDYGNDILAFECVKLSKSGKGCTYDEYAKISLDSILNGSNWFNDMSFLYIYSYYDGNSDTTNIYISMGSASGR